MRSSDLLRVTAGLLLVLAPTGLRAQGGQPPWLDVVDNDTVTLKWDFEGPTPLIPTVVVAPPWHSLAVTRLQPSAGIQVVNVAGHGQVLALVGNGTPRLETIALKVDNDPRPNWIKIFTVQFDALESTSGSIRAKLREAVNSPGNAYKRADIAESSEPIGGGWERVTIEANLIPQPWDEDIDWTLVETALGSDMIDNLVVNSRCVMPPPDDTGDALGDVDAGSILDVTSRTNNANCFGACAFSGGPGAGRYFVSARSTSPTQQLLVFELTAGGPGFTPVTTAIPTSPVPVSLGDLTLAQIPGRGPLIFGVVDQRATVGIGALTLKALDPTVIPATFVGAADVTLQAFPAGAQGPFGLAFDPDGNTGAGTFWVTERGGRAIEYRLDGTPTGQVITPAEGMPLGVAGAGYDRFTGMMYWWSQQPQPGPAGPVQVCGFEHSLFTHRPTGVRFFGDLTFGGAPAGGTALGMEVYRRSASDLRLLVMADVGGRSILYEMKAPFRFGHSLEGRTGMDNGPAYRGNANFGVTLRGVPDASLAMLLMGFDNQSHNGTPLPFPLSTLGLPETNITVAPELMATLRPVLQGLAREPLPIPALAALRGTPLFFQWMILDQTVPSGFTTSQSGKTIVW